MEKNGEKSIRGNQPRIFSFSKFAMSPQRFAQRSKRVKRISPTNLEYDFLLT